MRSRWSLFLAVALSLAVAPAFADVWDTATDNDNTSANTDNVPTHRTIQVHDLSVQPGPAEDNDWYGFQARGYASYEAVVDSTTGDTAVGLAFNIFADDGTTSLANPRNLNSPSCVGCSLSVAFENDQAAARDLFIRVGSAGCTTNCTVSDQYTFRFYETTYSAPRFNNAGGQITVMILHNVSEFPVVGRVNFFNPAGTRIAVHPFALPVNQHIVVNTSAVPGAAGAQGVVTVSHDGRFGALSGKTVALEPATGFSFDTPLSPKP